MRLLILGGTVFLGRHLVESALAQGHEVTICNRGKTNAKLFPEVEHLIGDRDGALNALIGKRWDAVIDTSGYVPRIVRYSASLLAGSVERYVFISSISVYGQVQRLGINESTAVARIEDPDVEEINGDTYGALKALCEEGVEAAIPDCVLNVRPGLIAGPFDPTDRFTYWARRVTRGGDILCAGQHRPVQFIDVRDLADWIILMVEKGEVGTYNATGPDYVLTMGEMLDAIKDATGSSANFIWATDEEMERFEVQPWVDMPLWIPEKHEMRGFCTINCDRAKENGLIYRSLANTVRDTVRWDVSRDSGQPLKAGLKPEREQEILSQLSKPKA